MERDRATKSNSGFKYSKKALLNTRNSAEKVYSGNNAKRDSKKECKRENSRENNKDSNDKLRCVAVAGVSGILTIFVILCILAVVLTTGALPLGAISFLGAAVGCLGAFVSGFVCSRMYRQNGFFFGMICAAILFAILFLVSFAVVAQPPTVFALVKLLSMLICGALGGSVGVNMKRRA